MSSWHTIAAVQQRRLKAVATGMDPGTVAGASVLRQIALAMGIPERLNVHLADPKFGAKGFSQAYSAWYGTFSPPAKHFRPLAVDPGSDEERVELYPGGHDGGADSGSDEDCEMGGKGPLGVSTSTSIVSGRGSNKGMQAGGGGGSSGGGGGSKGAARGRADEAAVMRRRRRRVRREAEQLREGLAQMLKRWQGSHQLRRLAEAEAALCAALRELEGAQQEEGDGEMEEAKGVQEQAAAAAEAIAGACAGAGASAAAGACAAGGGLDGLRLRVAAARGEYDEAYASLRWLFEDIGRSIVLLVEQGDLYRSPHIFLKDQPNQGNEDQAADVWGPELWAELRERAAGGAARPELKRRLREAAQRAVEARGNREVQAAVGWALLEACEGYSVAVSLDALRLTTTASALHTLRRRTCQRMTDRLAARVWDALEHLMEKEGTLWGRGAARAGYSSKVNAREAAQDGQREDGEEGEGAHAGAWEGLGVKGFSGALRSGSGPQGVAAEAIEAAAEATSGSEVEEREEFMLDRKEETELMRKMVVWVDAIVLMRRLQQRCLLPLRRRAHEHRVATLRRLAAEEQAKLDAATAAAAAVAGAAPAPGGEARGSSEATCASTLSSSKEGPSAVTTSAGALRASATQPGGLVVAHTGGCQPSEYDERGWLLLARLSLVRHLLHRWQGLVDAWLAELDSQLRTRGGVADPELLRLFRLQLAVRGTGADIKTGLASIRYTAAQQLLGLARLGLLQTARAERAKQDIIQAGRSLHSLHDQLHSCPTEPKPSQQQQQQQRQPPPPQQQKGAPSSQAYVPMRAAGEVPKPPPAAAANGEAPSTQDETNSPEANTNGHCNGSSDVAFAVAANSEGTAEVEVQAGVEAEAEAGARLISGTFGDAWDPDTWQGEDAAPFAELCHDADFWGCMPVTAGVSDAELFGRQPLGEGSMRLGWTRRVGQGRRGREDGTWGYHQDVHLAERILRRWPVCALGRRSLVLLLLRLSHPTGLHAWLPYALGPPPLEALLPPTTPAATWASRSTDPYSPADDVPSAVLLLPLGRVAPDSLDVHFGARLVAKEFMDRRPAELMKNVRVSLQMHRLCILLCETLEEVERVVLTFAKLREEVSKSPTPIDVGCWARLRTDDVPKAAELGVTEVCKALAEHGMWLAISELRSARGGAAAL